MNILKLLLISSMIMIFFIPSSGIILAEDAQERALYTAMFPAPEMNDSNIDLETAPDQKIALPAEPLPSTLLGWSINDTKQIACWHPTSQRMISVMCLGIANDVIVLVENDPAILYEWNEYKGNSTAWFMQNRLYNPMKENFGVPPKCFDDTNGIALVVSNLEGSGAAGYSIGSSVSVNGYSCIYVDYRSQNFNYEVIAHEMQHAIHGNYRYQSQPPWAEWWYNEGMAETAPGLTGVRENASEFIGAARGWPTPSPGSGPSNTPLLYWDYDNKLGVETDNYACGFLMVWYIGEHFGWDLLGEIMKSEHVANGSVIENLEAGLADRGISKAFNDIFTDWAFAVNLDNPGIICTNFPKSATGKEYAFGDFNIVTPANNGVAPESADDLSLNTSITSINNWIWHRGTSTWMMNDLYDSGKKRLKYTFDGDDAGSFAVYVVIEQYQTGGKTLPFATKMTLDPVTQNGEAIVIVPDKAMDAKLLVLNLKGDSAKAIFNDPVDPNRPWQVQFTPALVNTIRNYFNYTIEELPGLPSSSTPTVTSTPNFLTMPVILALMVCLIYQRKHLR